MSEPSVPRVPLVVATVLAALLVLGVIVASQVVGDVDDAPVTGPSASGQPRPSGPLALVSVDAPDAGGPACVSLLDVVPATLPSKGSELARLPLAAPAPPATAAWAGDRGEPVVLRCGLGKPAEYQATARLRQVSAVSWLPVEGAGATTWYTVDRPVYIALTIPDGTGTGVVQELSETIATAVPAA